MSKPPKIYVWQYTHYIKSCDFYKEIYDSSDLQEQQPEGNNSIKKYTKL